MLSRTRCSVTLLRRAGTHNGVLEVMAWIDDARA